MLPQLPKKVFIDLKPYIKSKIEEFHVKKSFTFIKIKISLSLQANRGRIYFVKIYDSLSLTNESDLSTLPLNDSPIY